LFNRSLQERKYFHHAFGFQRLSDVEIQRYGIRGHLHGNYRVAKCRYNGINLPHEERYSAKLIWHILKTYFQIYAVSATPNLNPSSIRSPNVIDHE